MKRVSSAGLRTLDEAFEPRANAIGALRLVFAWMVVVSHAFILTGRGKREPLVALTGGQEGLGGLAVVCFFVLSGLLIMRSLEGSTSTRRYLWHRFLRIMPGYWVCLVVTAFVFGMLAWIGAHGTTAGYFDATPSPIGYITNNAALFLRQYAIGDTLQTLPLPGLLNGPLWTLATEFACYLVLAVVGTVALRRGSATVVATSVAGLALVIYSSGFFWTELAVATELIHLRWCLGFALGAAAYCLRRRLPIDDRLAVGAFALLVAAVSLHIYWPLAPIPVAYIVIWAAVRLPLRTPRADLSYGTYVYAFPIEQLLVLAGLGRVGIGVYLGASVPLIVGAATLSWFLVERPALTLKSIRGPSDAMGRARRPWIMGGPASRDP